MKKAPRRPLLPARRLQWWMRSPMHPLSVLHWQPLRIAGTTHSDRHRKHGLRYNEPI
ncbi:MAG: hypothetical protein OJF62_001228 [Pseudolabrys sp.]|nr:hypothetical protein [Pseudolabrys sp.]